MLMVYVRGCVCEGLCLQGGDTNVKVSMIRLKTNSLNDVNKNIEDGNTKWYLIYI